MAKAITESAPVGKDQEKVVNIIISVVSIMRICTITQINESATNEKLDGHRDEEK